MFRFEREQKVFDIEGIKVGGQPGEYPTCLIPSIFYDKHKIVSDPLKGEFDKLQAETLLNKVEELSDKTGNPFFVDVMGTSVEAMIKFASFVSEVTTNPFLIDSSSRQARIETMRHICEVGLTDRAIYNSINYLITDEELKALKDFGAKSAIVLAFDPNKPLQEKQAILNGTVNQRGLLRVAEEAGIKKVLIDTAVLNVPSIGTAGKAIYAVKEKLGLPAGCAPANALAIWKKLRMGEFGPLARKVCLGASSLFTQAMGADFVIQGPIEFAEAAFPACAMADAIIASETERLGTNIRDKASHPLFKIF
jgi:tetrahydromethanopterin S-methyltransferase subunit H